MEKLQQYQIDLKSLSPATTYKYSYLLDNDFFDRIDGPEVRKGSVNVSLSVIRVSSVFEMAFRLEGVITVTCDRCLEDLEIPVTTDNKLVVTFGETFAETSDERVIVSEEEGFINIAWFMYEFIALAIPMKHVHKSGDCNAVMASKLREHWVDDQIGEEENSALRDGNRAVDPRWDKLRNLLEDN